MCSSDLTDAGQVMSANGVRQMSRPWITHAFLQESRGNSNPAVQEHLRVLRQWMCERRRMPQLWLNVYGAPRVGGNPHLYLLPGVYAVECRVGPLNQPVQTPNSPEDGANDAISGPIRANWGDDPYRPLEFFSLDARTTKSPGLTGDFHDYSEQFREICGHDQLNEQAVQEAEGDANRAYFNVDEG